MVNFTAEYAWYINITITVIKINQTLYKYSLVLYKQSSFVLIYKKPSLKPLIPYFYPASHLNVMFSDKKT